MTVHKHNRTTAGAKAPDDISKIACEMGAEEIIFVAPPIFKHLQLTRFFAMFIGLKNWLNLLLKIEKNAYVIIQHPNENIVVANWVINFCKKIKQCKFIFLIHDLESLRQSLIYKNTSSFYKRNNLADEKLMRKADYLICHNNSMKKYLIERGFDEKNIYELQIFDYLYDGRRTPQYKNDRSIIIAGNLDRKKAEYIYKLIKIKNLGFNVNLFGPNFTGKVDNQNVHYFGQCSPDKLPYKLKGAFGLVWDGTEIDGCFGNAGEYIQYNNPHKCSLFLASGIPVFIWKKAALAEFVEKWKVGYTIDNLCEISRIINSITDDEYKKLVNNVEKIGSQLRQGLYFKNVLKKIIAQEGFSI